MTARARRSHTRLRDGDVPYILKDQEDLTKNGFYVGTGLFTAIMRAPMPDDEVHLRTMPNGMPFPIFPTPGNTVNSSTVWQIVLTNPFDPSVSPIEFVPPVPRGNICHSIETLFTNIVDTRWR